MILASECPFCHRTKERQASMCGHCYADGNMRKRKPRQIDGVCKRKINRLGGEAYLKSLSPDVRAVLLRPHIYGGSKSLVRGGLKRLGMSRGKPTFDRFLPASVQT